jgi:hypothetical protein
MWCVCGINSVADPISVQLADAMHVEPEVARQMKQAAQYVELEKELELHEYLSPRLQTLLVQQGWGDAELARLSKQGSGDDFLTALCYQALDHKHAFLLASMKDGILLACRCRLSQMEQDLGWLQEVMLDAGTEESERCPNDYLVERFVKRSERELCRQQYMDFSNPESVSRLFQWLQAKEEGAWSAVEVALLESLSGEELAAALIERAFARRDWEVLQYLPQIYSPFIRHEAQSMKDSIGRGLKQIDQEMRRRQRAG